MGFFVVSYGEGERHEGEVIHEVRVCRASDIREAHERALPVLKRWAARAGIVELIPPARAAQRWRVQVGDVLYRFVEIVRAEEIT